MLLLLAAKTGRIVTFWNRDQLALLHVSENVSFYYHYTREHTSALNNKSPSLKKAKGF